MKEKKRARKDIPGNPSASRELGHWITYQLRRHGIRQRDLAYKWGISQESIAQAIWNRRRSAVARSALADALGFESWDELIQAQKGAA